MMDEAFIPLGQVIEGMLPPDREVVDEEAGVRTYIRGCEIESPVELSVFRDEGGALRVGTAPPLYYVDTSFRPSYHRLAFTARLTEGADGD